MKRLDFFVQTILILLGLFLFFFSINDGGALILLAQLLLGPWQLISACCYIRFRTVLQKERVLHLTISCLYLALLFTAFRESFYFTKTFDMLIIIIPSWILAICYYIITWRITFPNTKNRSSFLPHLNF
jgi:hypothetical protein